MDILIPVLILLVIGLIAGVGLAIASVVFAVPVDKKEEEIKSCLPGANCGACGYTGCDGYAKALAKGEAKIGLCAPGGEKAAEAIGKVMGQKVGKVAPKTAFVRCGGNCESAKVKMEYEGEKTCAAANQLYGGDKACSYGCIGFGDCKNACEYGAISICDGVAVIDPAACKGCGKCVLTCPKQIIDMVEAERTAAVRCNNKSKGGITRKACTAGCIGCMKCQKNCEFDAITVTDNVAYVDYSKCTFCGKCAEGCPAKCITLMDIESLKKDI